MYTTAVSAGLDCRWSARIWAAPYHHEPPRVRRSALPLAPGGLLGIEASRLLAHLLGYTGSTLLLLAAMAAQTKRIRLTSATTTISTLDPVRVFQDYSMVDLISGGRVELVLGRGAYTETFPLFGFNLSDYDALFAEKVEMFTQLNAQPRLTWAGRFRPPVHNVDVAPRPVQAKLPDCHGFSTVFFPKKSVYKKLMRNRI
jgi:alkanesulfonate monooxygenase SsuD/methylene tetrahydromethanopterin reductase-like flavin-dependent oxidoreductase (luciferase family)